MPNVTTLIKVLPVTCLILAGCTRDLPKSDKKVTPPKVETPAEEPFRKPTKKTPDDPNRNLPPVQTEARPDIVPDPHLGEKPKIGTTDGNGNRSSGNSGNSNGGSMRDAVAKKKSVIHWDELIKKFDLLNPQKTQERLKTVKTLIGEKADSEIARWVKSEKLHNLFIGFRFEVIEKGDKIQIAYSFFTPSPKDQDGNRVFEIPTLSQELTPQELESGAVLHVQGANEEGVASIAKTFGNVAVFKLKSDGDFLITHERADELGLGLIFHQDKKAFGAIAPLVQQVGGEENLPNVLKDFNIVNFIEIGRQKLRKQIDPLIALYEKLPELIASSPELSATQFVEFGRIMYDGLIKNKDNEEGFLVRLKGYTEATFERVLTGRIQEMEEAGKYIPLNDSLETLVSIYKTSLLETFKFIIDQKADGIKWLEKLKAEKPQIDIDKFVQQLTLSTVDEAEVSLALDFMGREILEAIVVDPGKASSKPTNKPAAPASPTAK